MRLLSLFSANESLLLTALDCIGLILRKASLKKEAVVSELMTQFAAKATGLRLAKRDNGKASVN